MDGDGCAAHAWTGQHLSQHAVAGSASGTGPYLRLGKVTEAIPAVTAAGCIPAQGKPGVQPLQPTGEGNADGRDGSGGGVKGILPKGLQEDLPCQHFCGMHCPGDAAVSGSKKDASVGVIPDAGKAVGRHDGLVVPDEIHPAVREQGVQRSFAG